MMVEGMGDIQNILQYISLKHLKHFDKYLADLSRWYVLIYSCERKKSFLTFF